MNLCAAIDTRLIWVYVCVYVCLLYMYIYHTCTKRALFGILNLLCCAACKWILNTFPQWIVFFCLLHLLPPSVTSPLFLSHSLPHSLCLRAREFPFKHRTLMENLVYTNSLQPTINRICNYNSRPTPHILLNAIYNYIRIRNIWYAVYFGIRYISNILHNRCPLVRPSNLPFLEREKNEIIFHCADKWFAYAATVSLGLCINIIYSGCRLRRQTHNLLSGRAESPRTEYTLSC